MNAPRLRVDPILCDGAGYCAEIAPELISPDDWGYPIIHDEALRTDDALRRVARAAVSICPRRALRLAEDAHHR